MATYVERQESESHPSVKDQAGRMVQDIQGEVKHEIEDIHAVKEPVTPSHSDCVVHVAGLSISFFVMIVLFLLIVIAGIAIYTHGHS